MCCHCEAQSNEAISVNKTLSLNKKKNSAKLFEIAIPHVRDRPPIAIGSNDIIEIAKSLRFLYRKDKITCLKRQIVFYIIRAKIIGGLKTVVYRRGNILRYIGGKFGDSPTLNGIEIFGFALG